MMYISHSPPKKCIFTVEPAYKKGTTCLSSPQILALTKMYRVSINIVLLHGLARTRTDTVDVAACFDATLVSTYARSHS